MNKMVFAPIVCLLFSACKSSSVRNTEASYKNVRGIVNGINVQHRVDGQGVDHTDCFIVPNNSNQGVNVNALDSQFQLQLAIASLQAWRVSVFYDSASEPFANEVKKIEFLNNNDEPVPSIYLRFRLAIAIAKAKNKPIEQAPPEETDTNRIKMMRVQDR